MVYGIQKGGRGGVVYCALDIHQHCNSVGNADGRGNKRMIGSEAKQYLVKANVHLVSRPDIDGVSHAYGDPWRVDLCFFVSVNTRWVCEV